MKTLVLGSGSFSGRAYIHYLEDLGESVHGLDHNDIDIKALAGAVWRGDAAPTLLMPNMTALNQIARATQGKA